MNAYKILLASCAIFATGLPAKAELNLWQQNFVGCSVSSSPYTTQVLFKDASKVRPLMQIAGMNAWRFQLLMAASKSRSPHRTV